MLIVHYGLPVVLYVKVRVDVQDMDKGKVLLSISFHGLLLYLLDQWIWDKQVVACSSQVFITTFWCDLGLTKWTNPTALFHMWKTWPYFTVLLSKYRSTSTARVSMTIIALSSSSTSFWLPKTGSRIKFECS